MLALASFLRIGLLFSFPPLWFRFITTSKRHFSLSSHLDHPNPPLLLPLASKSWPAATVTAIARSEVSPSLAHIHSFLFLAFIHTCKHRVVFDPFPHHYPTISHFPHYTNRRTHVYIYTDIQLNRPKRKKSGGIFFLTSHSLP